MMKVWLHLVDTFFEAANALVEVARNKLPLL